MSLGFDIVGMTRVFVVLSLSGQKLQLSRSQILCSQAWYYNNYAQTTLSYFSVDFYSAKGDKLG